MARPFNDVWKKGMAHARLKSTVRNRARAAKARKLCRTMGPAKKESDAEIADYLTRFPEPPNW